MALWPGISTYELVDPRDLTGKLNLLRLPLTHQFGVGDYPVIIRLNPSVGLPRLNTGGSDGVFGSWLHQHPVVLVDCPWVGEDYCHRVYGRFLRAGSFELYGVAGRADVGPDPLAFCDGIRARRVRDGRGINYIRGYRGDGADSAPPQAMATINTMEMSPSKKYANIFIRCLPGLFYLPGAQ